MSEAAIRSLKKPRDTFLKMADIKDFNALAKLSKNDIVELAKEFPNGMAELVIDLFSALKKKELQNAIQSKTIISLTDKEKQKAAEEASAQS